MLSCLIIEDQPPAQRILKAFIQDYGTLDLRETFSDPIKAMEFLREEPVDLIFLDIHLPKISGVDFLRSLTHPPAVIFTTAFADYALDGYELNVVDYLLKPFSFQRFVQAMGKVQAQILSHASQSETTGAYTFRTTFIKSGHEHIRIRVEDIIYIHSDADYTEIHLPSKKYLSNEPLRYWMEALPQEEFIRIHKSYIVHLDKVEKVSGNQVYLPGGATLPIGRAYKDGLMGRIEN